MKFFLKSYDDIKEEWDKKKNSTPFNSAKKSLKYWWKCGENHSWEASLNNRLRGDKCPYCSGKSLIISFNDFATMNNDLAKEWDFSKNAIKPSEIHYKTLAKFWWLCPDKKHSWKSSAISRTKGKKCPICKNREVEKGINDLKTLFPEIFKDLYDKEQILHPGTDKKVTWICSNNHKTLESVRARVRHKDCRKCRTVSYDEALIKKWDHSKNTIKPDEITPGSNKIVWWTCELNHSWSRSPKNQLKSKVCPYCSGSRMLQGFNDLLSTFPNLCKSWDYDKNTIGPDQVYYNSTKIFYWCCSNCKNEWKAPASQRRDCPKCYTLKSSVLEREVRDFTYSIIPEKTNVHCNYRGYRKYGVNEIDIYLPELDIAIEVNGTYWHSDAFLSKSNLTSHRKHKNIQISLNKLNTIVAFVWEDDWNLRKDEIKLSLVKLIETQEIDPILEKLEKS